MSALLEHIKCQHDNARLLASPIDTLNVIIRMPNRKELLFQLAKEAQGIADGLALYLDSEMLPEDVSEADEQDQPIAWLCPISDTRVMA